MLAQLGDPRPALPFLDVLRTNLRACSEAFDRRVRFLMIAILVSEFVAHSVVSEIAVGGSKISDLSVIEKLMPAAVAYAYYSMMHAVVYRRLLEDAHDESMKRALPAFYENQLHHFALPPSVLHVERIIAADSTGRFHRLAAGASWPFLAGLALGPAFYVAYSVANGFSRFGGSDPLMWISTVVGALFLAQVVVLFVASHRLTSPGPLG